MRQFVVSKAPVTRVAKQVRETVEEAGGIVAHHTAHKTEFDHLDYGDHAWRRAGYVGTYQRFKEKPVQVRVRVWAQWPRRLLLWSIYLGFAEAVLFFLASIFGMAIPPNVWIFTALPTLAAIAISLLLYTSSIPDSKTAEERIEADLAERLAEDEHVPGEIYDVDAWENHRDRLIEEAREEAKAKTPHQGSKVRKAVATARSSVSGAMPTTSEERPTEDEQPQPDAGDETEDEGLEADEDDGETSFTDKIPLLGSSDEEDTDEPRDDDLEASEDDEDDSSLTDKIPLLGSSDDEGTDDEAEDLEADEDAGEDESLTDKIPLLGSSEDDETDEPQEEDLEADEADEGGLADKLPFLGSSDDGEDEPGEEAEEDGGSLVDRVPFLGSEGDEETSPEGDQDDETPGNEAEDGSAGDEDGEDQET